MYIIATYFAGAIISWAIFFKIAIESDDTFTEPTQVFVLGAVSLLLAPFWPLFALFSLLLALVGEKR